MKELGRTSMKISRLSLGGIPFQRVDKKTTYEIMKRAKELGINFIDTARGYTVSEEFIGYGLEKLGRDSFYIATKSMKRDRPGIEEELQISLGNLRTDFIDLYQFHNVSNQADFEKLFEADGAYDFLLEKKREGVIKHIGLTSHSLDILEQAIASDKFETIQFPYNAVERQAEELFKVAHQKGMGVIAMKPYAGGAIRNKEFALRFLMENECITAVIPGVDSIEQVEDNCSWIGKGILSDEERQVLTAESQELGEHFCRRCNYCAPCTVGINIPQVFLFEGYYSRYKLTDWTKDRYQKLEKKAKDCIKCGACESRCPYHLPIIKMMENVSKVLDGEEI